MKGVIMYSYEIQKIMEEKGYRIDSELFVYICEQSNQITGIVYSPYDDYVDLMTEDGCHWRFLVYRKKD